MPKRAKKLTSKVSFPPPDPVITVPSNGKVNWSYSAGGILSAVGLGVSHAAEERGYGVASARGASAGGQQAAMLTNGIPALDAAKALWQMQKRWHDWRFCLKSVVQCDRIQYILSNGTCMSTRLMFELLVAELGLKTQDDRLTLMASAFDAAALEAQNPLMLAPWLLKNNPHHPRNYTGDNYNLVDALTGITAVPGLFVPPLETTRDDRRIYALDGAIENYNTPSERPCIVVRYSKPTAMGEGATLAATQWTEFYRNVVEKMAQLQSPNDWGKFYESAIRFGLRNHFKDLCKFFGMDFETPADMLQQWIGVYAPLCGNNRYVDPHHLIIDTGCDFVAGLRRVDEETFWMLFQKGIKDGHEQLAAFERNKQLVVA